MAGQIYEYAVLFHPRTKKDGVAEPSTLVVDVQRLVAASEKEVAILAGRSIPDAYLDKLEQVEIAIRPF